MSNKLIQRVMVENGLYRYSIQTDDGIRTYSVYRSDDHKGRWVYKKLVDVPPTKSYDTQFAAERALYAALGIKP